MTPRVFVRDSESAAAADNPGKKGRSGSRIRVSVENNVNCSLNCRVAAGPGPRWDRSDRPPAPMMTGLMTRILEISGKMSTA